MSWKIWADELRHTPSLAVSGLLCGAANVSSFERIAPHEFLLAVLPRHSRLISSGLLGEPSAIIPESDLTADLPALVDTGLTTWLLSQRQAPLPAARKLSAYAAQVCEALQWPLYFKLPQTRAALRTERVRWLQWLGSLTLTTYRDPEYDYWQVLASQQDDDALQFFWQSFVVEAGRNRSNRYKNLGLLALARLPLTEEDSLRNLRLQVQALVNRYQRRKGWGAPAQQDLAEALRSVMARNLSMSRDNYRTFLEELLSPLDEEKVNSVLSLLGLARTRHQSISRSHAAYKLQPPAGKKETDQASQAISQSSSLAQAWNAIRPLLAAHEDYLYRSGVYYNFVRTLDICARALCKKYRLCDPEVQPRLFQWIHLALRVDADDPRLWMLWELALRQADQPQRAQWVLWEMTRRFPEHLPCRVELARLLVESGERDNKTQAKRLLQQVLALDPNHLHAHSTLAQLAIGRRDWAAAFKHAQDGLMVDPKNEACAVLQATVYARRADPNDLQIAIKKLQQFVDRYPENLNAKDYLGDLRRREKLASNGRIRSFEDNEVTVIPSSPASPETDPAWAAFAESISTWMALSATPSTPTASSPDRVLSLPQALKQAVTEQRWDADVLGDYDAATLQEFPLETRLWRYLQMVQTHASMADIERAKQTVVQWLETETSTAQQDNQRWRPFLHQHWDSAQPIDDHSLAVEASWLLDLVDRYQPLPAPLLA